MTIWIQLTAALGAFAVLGIVCSVVSHLVLWRVLRRPGGADGRQETVTVLRPICGADPSLRQNLDCLARQTYENLEVVLGFASPNDDALHIAREFCRNHPQLRTHIVVGENASIINPKVALLDRMRDSASGQWLVISDSNVCVANDYVARALAHGEPDVGLITHLVCGCGGSSLAARMENLQLNCFIAPAVCGARFFAARTCVIGKSMFIRKEVLDKIGGMRSVGHYLAEDYAMGRAIEGAGYRVATVEAPVPAWHDGWTLRKFLNRHLRWAVMRRRVSVAAYVLELLYTPGPLLVALLLTSLLWGASPIRPHWALAALLVQTCLVPLTYWRMTGKLIPLTTLLLNPLRELMTIGLWVQGWFVQTIEWRGKFYQVRADTLLEATADNALDNLVDET